MISLRTILTAPAAIAATAALAGTTILLGAPTASATPTIFTLARPLLQHQGLSVQQSAGFLGAEGPATSVEAASAELRLGGVGNTALYTGARETGTGFLVISGNGVPPTIDFQVMGMTAASIENNSTQLNAVYSDDGSELDAVVAAETATDITPVDVDYAVYPLGSTPPPDNHGLNPNAQFDFAGFA